MLTRFQSTLRKYCAVFYFSWSNVICYIPADLLTFSTSSGPFQKLGLFYGSCLKMRDKRTSTAPSKLIICYRIVRCFLSNFPLLGYCTNSVMSVRLYPSSRHLNLDSLMEHDVRVNYMLYILNTSVTFGFFILTRIISCLLTHSLTYLLNY